MRTLHGGRQEGVGISIRYRRNEDFGRRYARHERPGSRCRKSAALAGIRRSAKSVNPAFIELNGRGGLGWLEGFNEMVTRCGYEWVGHPGIG